MPFAGGPRGSKRTAGRCNRAGISGADPVAGAGGFIALAAPIHASNSTPPGNASHSTRQTGHALRLRPARSLEKQIKGVGAIP